MMLPELDSRCSREDKLDTEPCKSKATFHYFAYGSNMDVAQMRRRVGFTGTPRAACLSGYQLTFNKFSFKRQCGAANLIFTGDKADTVEGVVYQLSSEQLARLDRFEGFNTAKQRANPRGYERISLELDDGSNAQVYIIDIRLQAQPRQARQGEEHRVIRFMKTLLNIVSVQVDADAQADLLPSVTYMCHLLMGHKYGYVSLQKFTEFLNTQVIEGGLLKEYVEPADYQPCSIK